MMEIYMYRMCMLCISIYYICEGIKVDVHVSQLSVEGDCGGAIYRSFGKHEDTRG